MPVKLIKLKSGKVKVVTPGGVKAKGTTREKALAQKFILDMAERKKKGQSHAKLKALGY